MTEWEKCSIGELIDRRAILIHKDGNHGANYPRASDFGDEGLRFLTAKSLSDWRIDLEGAPRLSRDKAKTFKFGFVQEGDVLLSHNATVGRVGIVPEMDEVAVIGTSLTQFRVDKSKLLPEFLAIYFSSRQFQDQLSFVMAQTTRNQVPITEQRRLPVVVPPFDTQRQISETIFSLQRKIELNRRMNETLEAMAQVIFRDWFVDFGPTRRKLAGITDPIEIMGGLTTDPARATELAALFPAAFWDNGLPDRWERRRVAELAARVAMGPFGSNITKDNFVSDGVPVIRGKNLASGFIDDDFVYLTPDKASSLSSSAAYQGDIVFTHRGTLGQVGRIYVGSRHDTYIASQSQLVLSIDRAKASPIAVYQFFRSEEGQRAWLANAGGAGVPAIGRPTASLKEITITVPCLGVSKEYEAIVGLLERRQVSALREASTLAKLRDLLLPKLMSGEIRLRDAEAIAGGAL